MSGTSCDGVSAACVEFDERGRQVRVLRSATIAYPPHVRARLLALPGAPAGEIARMHFALGARFRDAVRRVWMRGAETIGVHGHTAWHGSAATLQIGEAASLAQAFRVPVVHDFRSADVAAGGHGAPLAPRFDLDFFASRGRAMLNLGGIANVTLPDGRAFDIGPGVMLMDEAARRMGRPYDRDGALAARGRPDRRLLARLLRHPYLRRAPPKTTGREDFGADFYERMVGRTGVDVLTTLTLFTARIVADALRPFRLREIVVSGGGARNPTLMRMLSEEMRPVRVRSLAELGMDPLAKECAIFAWLALLRLDGRPGNVPQATGARRAVVLGSVVRG
jgi:anhydro-N-acetylmuramic acid kinase